MCVFLGADAGPPATSARCTNGSSGDATPGRGGGTGAGGGVGAVIDVL